MSMDRSSRICMRTTLKLANSIMLLAGIAILMYSVWIIVVCLRDYQKHHFPWFLWVCIGTGAIFCFTAFIGHIAVARRNNCLLSLYILAVFLLLLAEILVTADVFLNDDWDKDFPKDPTHRFDDFVDFADDNEKVFSFLAILLLFSQVVSFILAMILRTMHHNHRSFLEDEHDDQIPVGAPYVLGHPQYPPETHVHGAGDALLEKDSYKPHQEKGVWSMFGGGGTAGYPPIHP
ncbi:hypothetical protein KSS87_011206 [Heliosperma pusillum]|nr:hypothetical protein KSS87_011206 [Heliosperma pusillum]